MRKEFCARCDEPTGKAGNEDDSNYFEAGGEVYGPFCDECHDSILHIIDSWWRCLSGYELKR